MDEFKPLIEAIRERLCDRESNIRIACQEETFLALPRKSLGKITVLVIAANSEERARFISFMHRKNLNKFPINVDYFSRDNPASAKALNYDYVIVTEPNESMTFFIKQLVRAKIPYIHNVQIWCLKNKHKY